jgi:hypothetical protein
MKRSVWLFCAIIALFATVAFAQDEMPPIYSMWFSEGMLAAMAAVIAFTKIIRNLLGGVKGWVALVVTGVVSLVYAFIQYQTHGMIYSIGVGLFAFLASAGVFKASKLIGGVVGKKKIDG